MPTVPSPTRLKRTGTAPTTFVYEVTSSTGGSIEATASIVVEPLNDAPLAEDDEFSGLVDAVITGGVTGNDSDIDGDPLTARLIRGTEDGELVFNPDGTFTYTPDAGFIGEDFFTYQLNDGLANSRVAKVTLTVGGITNAAPQGIDDAYTVGGRRDADRGCAGRARQRHRRRWRSADGDPR